MKARTFILLISVMTAYQAVRSQDTPIEKGLGAINTGVLKAQMGFLSSDWMEGREAGTRGEYLSGEYIASLLQIYGVKPGGDYLRPSIPGQESDRSYFQNMTLIKTSQGEVQEFKLKTIEASSVTTLALNKNIDFYIRPQDRSMEIEAPVVFAGYGFKNDKLNYNDFGSQDLKGKFILRITGTPEYARARLTGAELSASVREVDEMLRNAGIAGIIEFNPLAKYPVVPGPPSMPEMSPSEKRIFPAGRYSRYSLPGSRSGQDLPRILISESAAEMILHGTGVSVADYRKRAETGKPGAALLTGRKIYIRTDVITEAVPSRNVIGIIEGKDTDQVIILGAHYDHEGMSDGYIWNGADDNASGTVGVLSLAKAITETGTIPGKTIIFALWTAEEKGLLGSRYYIDNLSFPKENIRLNMNFDMISRYIAEDNPDGVIMTYTASCPQFKSITESNLKKYGIKLTVDYQGSDKPSGPSDEGTFVNAGIPIIRYKTSHREEYHTPADEISTIDWDIMEKIIRISFANVWELANSSW